MNTDRPTMLTEGYDPLISAPRRSRRDRSQIEFYKPGLDYVYYIDASESSHKIRDGLDSQESDMGAGQTTSWKKAATLQMGVPIQVCIQLRETQVQSSACRERIQTRIRG